MSAGRERPLVPVAEIGLVLVTVAAVLGMQRLFADGSWRVPLLVHAVAAHGVALLLRRRGASLPLAAVVMAVGAALTVAWTSYWSTTAIGIPTGDTWSAARGDLSSSWSLYQDVVAPAPVEVGFIVASALAVWCIAYVADWAAFRLWVPFEATLPAGTLFLFTALLGVDKGRGWAVGIYAAALVGFLLVHRVARQDSTTHWVADRRASGQRSLLVVGSALGTMAVLVGVVVGPNLPGADSSGILDPRDLNDDNDARVTISPLVDIRSRLVDQANVEVFQVRSSERAYWRLTSLERFDGRIWSSSGTYGEADGDLPDAYDGDAASVPVEQSYTISALAAIWLPSAYEPEAYRGDDADVRYDEDSSTLIVDAALPTSDGLSYEITSAAPRVGPDDLTGEPAAIPKEIRDRYTELPSDFSPRVRELAAEVTGTLATPFARARGLQDFLRTFEYSLEVSGGHGEDALETFLFDTRTGYCEQFAGAFAAMARSLDLPARVAVGFTPGQVDPDDLTLYRVRGEHAHAWPEVFFAGTGWVAFEPTPGRGMPAAESYTGVPESQAAAGQPNQVEVVPVPAPTTTAPNGNDPEGNDQGNDTTTTTAPDRSDDESEDESALDQITDSLKVIVLVALALGLVYLLVVPAALGTYRRSRRRRADTPQRRIALAWVEALEGAALVGYVLRRSDTYDARAAQLSLLLPHREEDAVTLARSAEEADYSADGADEELAVVAVEASDRIQASAREMTSVKQRLGRWLDPRPTVRTWRAERATTPRRRTTVAVGE